MKHDEYKDERIFDDFYMSNKVDGGTDLHEIYFDEWKLRSIVNNRFRELILRDMIALCQQIVEIFFRSSLKSKKCTCLMINQKLKSDKFVTFSPLNLFSDN